MLLTPKFLLGVGYATIAGVCALNAVLLTTALKLPSDAGVQLNPYNLPPAATSLCAAVLEPVMVPSVELHYRAAACLIRSSDWSYCVREFWMFLVA